MKKITLSADEDLIGQARLVAKSRNTTLNAALRQWLLEYARPVGDVNEFGSLMKRLRHVKAGRSFTRQEINEA